MTAYLRPTAPIAATALLPGDPGRAMALATTLLGAPLMSNHHRGLWGYHGVTETGAELTIQSTGIGGPSAAVVLRELSGLGVRSAIRIGTCRALDSGLELGELVVVEEAVPLDGTSAALGCSEVLAPDPALTDGVRKALNEARAGAVATVDLMPLIGEAGPQVNALALDLATAPVLGLGAQLGLAVAAILVVSETKVGDQIADQRLETESLAASRVAASALGAATRSWS